MPDLLTWIASSPVLLGEPLNLNFLPSRGGWSLCPGKETVRTDILGNSRRSLSLTVTLRTTVSDNADRLAALGRLEDLADWMRQNPPPGSRLRETSLPEFASRAGSSVEDFCMTLTLTES